MAHRPRGGARPGAGRPRSGPRPSEPHKARPALSPRHPVEVTARVVPGLVLQRRRAYRAIRRAVRTSLGRVDFRIVDLEVRRTAVVLLVEADDAEALARGVQGFEIAAARYLNRSAGRRGIVFPDRYRARTLRTRRAVRAVVVALPRRERTCSPATWLLRVETPRAWKPP